MSNQFHDDLKNLMDELLNEIYFITKNFPKDEVYGLTSQIRRAALSIILNYIEGYARRRKAVLKNFLEISYGSLKEVKYLIYFSWKQEYLSRDKHDKLLAITDKIGAMLWGILDKLES